MPTTITREQFDLARQFTVGDIRREVELAKAWLGRLGPESQGHLEASGVQPSGGGNLLAALGLFCYTEFFGLVKFDRRYPSGHPKAGQRKGLPSGGMLGYVMDGRMADALSRVQLEAVRRAPALQMGSPPRFSIPSSLLPDHRWSADSVHDRADGAFNLHHALVRCTVARNKRHSRRSAAARGPKRSRTPS